MRSECKGLLAVPGRLVLTNKGQHYPRDSMLVVLAQVAPSPRQWEDGNWAWKEPVFCFEDVCLKTRPWLVSGLARRRTSFLRSKRGTTATLLGGCYLGSILSNRHDASVYLAQLVDSSSSHVMEEGFIHEHFAEEKWAQIAGGRENLNQTLKPPFYVNPRLGGCSPKG